MLQIAYFGLYVYTEVLTSAGPDLKKHGTLDNYMTQINVGHPGLKSPPPTLQDFVNLIYYANK